MAFAISLIGCRRATATCDRATECSQPSTPSLATSSTPNGATPSSVRVRSTKARRSGGVSFCRSTDAASVGSWRA